MAMAEENHSEEDGLAAQAAFGVLVNQVTAEIANENEFIHAENVRLQPLVDYIKSIEIRVDGEAVAHCNFETYSGIQEDEIGRSCCVEIAKNNSTALPIEKYLLSHETTDAPALYMADQCVGRIPCDMSDIHIKCYNQNTVDILMKASPLIMVAGHLGNLSAEELSRGEELLTDIKYYLMGYTARMSPGVTFKPSALMVCLDDEIGEMFDLIHAPKEANYTSNNQDPSYELRTGVLAALGDNDHLSMLRRNRDLKIEQYHLSCIRTRLGSVVLSYVGLNHDPLYKCVISLEKGTYIAKDGESVWRVALAGQFEDIPLSYLHKYSATLSGIPLVLERERVSLTDTFSLLCHESRLSPGLDVTGYFDDQSDDSDYLSTPAGGTMVSEALRNPARSGELPTVNLVLYQIEIELRCIEHLLRTLDIPIHPVPVDA